MDNTNFWPKTYKELASFLGCQRTTLYTYTRRFSRFFIEGKHYKYREKIGGKGDSRERLWLKDGALIIAEPLRSKEARMFREHNSNGKIIVKPSKESEFIGVIKKAIKGFTTVKTKQNVHEPIPNYKSFRYRYQVDLYLPDLQLVIECDEYNHKNYNSFADNEREKFIKNALKCDFIRFNPDDPNFNIGDVINKLFRIIIKRDYEK